MDGRQLPDFTRCPSSYFFIHIRKQSLFSGKMVSCRQNVSPEIHIPRAMAWPGLPVSMGVAGQCRVFLWGQVHL